MVHALALLGSLAAKNPVRRPPSTPPFYIIVPFIIIVVLFIAVMIWLIVSDERADARRRADEQKARGLKFGRMDPRYAKDS